MRMPKLNELNKMNGPISTNLFCKVQSISFTGRDVMINHRSRMDRIVYVSHKHKIYWIRSELMVFGLNLCEHALATTNKLCGFNRRLITLTSEFRLVNYSKMATLFGPKWARYLQRWAELNMLNQIRLITWSIFKLPHKQHFAQNRIVSNYV